MLTRRAAAQIFATAAATAALGGGTIRPAHAADKVVKIGSDLSLTGADSQGAVKVRNAITMAVDGSNEAGAIPGYPGRGYCRSAAAPRRPASMIRRRPPQRAQDMVSDKDVVAAIGPQMSGAGKAMAPILSQGDLATITPSSTNPDITDPKFAAQCTVPPARCRSTSAPSTTDAYQGHNMANFFAEKLQGKVGLRARRQRRSASASRLVPEAGRKERA